MRMQAVSRVSLQNRCRTDEYTVHDSSKVMAALAKGDHAALEKLMRTFWRLLADYASRLLDDRDAAEDVVQGVFVKIWAGRSKWTSQSVKGLLFTLARNAALDELRKRRSRARVISIAPRFGVANANTPSEILERDRLSGVVEKAIQNLPPRRKEVFDLAYLRGLSYEEIGKVMGISPKTVGNHMTAALRQLRQELKPLLSEATDAEAVTFPYFRPQPGQAQNENSSFRIIPMST